MFLNLMWWQYADDKSSRNISRISFWVHIKHSKMTWKIKEKHGTSDTFFTKRPENWKRDLIVLISCGLLEECFFSQSNTQIFEVGSEGERTWVAQIIHFNSKLPIASVYHFNTVVLLIFMLVQMFCIQMYEIVLKKIMIRLLMPLIPVAWKLKYSLGEVNALGTCTTTWKLGGTTTTEL